MRKSLLTTIAAAALIAGAGLAKAQQTPGHNRPNDVQSNSARQPSAATNPSERQPGATESQGRSAATGQKEHRSGQPGARESQGRSAATGQKEHRSGQPGAMESRGRSAATEQKEHRAGQPGARESHGRSAATEQKEHRSGQPGAMQGRGRSAATEQREHRSGQPGAMERQGRSAATEQKEHRPGQPGAMQGHAQGRSGAIQSPAQGRSASEQNRGGASQQSVASVNLSPDQRTRLHDAIAGGDVQRLDRVDFDLSAGTLIPGGVSFYPIPDSIVEIVPQYRGFDYIVAEDELVIVDPDTREIVAVQSDEALGPAQFGSNERQGRITEQRSVGSTTLSPGQKTRLHKIISGGDVQHVNHVDFPLSVGTRVPHTVTLYNIPQTIVDILPQYRDFEYVVVGNEMVIIDPDTLEIVAVLPA